MKNARNFVVAAVVLVAVVIGVGVWKGAIPPKFGTEGAIGAAQRYTSQQITDTDVQLSNASIQAFIQSDLFHAIATNPDFQRLIKSDAFKKTAQVEGLFDVVAQDLGHGTSKKDFNELVASADFQEMTASADFKTAIKDKKVQNLLANADFQELVASADFQNYIADMAKGIKKGDASKTTIKDAQKGGKSAEWLELTANADMSEALANADFIEAAASTDMGKIIKDNQNWFANEDFMEVLANEDFQELVASADFQELVASAEYQHLTENQDFQNLVASEDFQKIAKHDYATIIAASEDMAKNKKN